MKRFRSNTTMFSFVEKFGKAVSVFLIFSFMGFNTSSALIAYANLDDNEGDQTISVVPPSVNIQDENKEHETPTSVTLCKTDDTDSHNKLSGWTLTLKSSSWDSDDDKKSKDEDEHHKHNEGHHDEDNVDESHGYVGITGENGCVTFSKVHEGHYTIGEVMQDGWNNVSGLSDIKVNEHGTQTFTVVNHHIDVCPNLDGYQKEVPAGYHKINTLDQEMCVPDFVKVKLCKSDDLGNMLSGWNLTLNSQEDKNDEDESHNFQGVTGSDGCVTFSHVPYGNYKVGEVMKEGWTLRSLPNENGNIQAYNETQTFTIVNHHNTSDSSCDANVNLIQNGGFEAPALANPSWSIIPDTNALLKWLVAWTNPTPSSGTLGLEIQNHVAGSPFAGSQHAELDGDHPTTIWQNVTTVPGKAYSLIFKYSPRPGVSDNRIKVKLNGADLGAELSADGSSNGDTVWQTITRTFTATGTTSKIEFTDTGADDSLGGYLDNVDLRCTGDACNSEASSSIASDTSVQVDGHDSALVSWIHPGWTASIPGAKWIWSESEIVDPSIDTTKVFTKTFTVVGAPKDSSLSVAADNSYFVKVNGDLMLGAGCSDTTGGTFGGAQTCAIPASALMTGTNTLSITVKNFALGTDKQANPAGLLFKLTLNNNECLPPVIDVCTNIPGIQTTMPEGKHLVEGQCVDIVPPPTVDVCPNIDGVQTVVPEGFHLNNDNQCVADTNGGGGGNGGGGDGRHGGGGGLLALSQGRVLGASTSCGIYVDKFLRRGYKNDTDAVKKLQKFLNDYMNAGLKEDGNFNLKTEKALKKFQLKHADDILTPWGFKAPTGIFYLTTQTKVNNIMCPDLKLQIPTLTPIEENPLAPKRD